MAIYSKAFKYYYIHLAVIQIIKRQFLVYLRKLSRHLFLGHPHSVLPLASSMYTFFTSLTYSFPPVFPSTSFNLLLLHYVHHCFLSK